MKKLRLIIPIMFAFILSIGMLSPALALDTAYFRVDPTITTVSVGETFQVKIYINGLSPANKMKEFLFIITWDNYLMEFAGHSVNRPTGWKSEIHGGVNHYVSGDPYTSYFTLKAYKDTGEATSDTTWYWETFTFRCLREGSSPLNLPSSVTDSSGSPTYQAYIEGMNDPYELSDPAKGAVNQIQPHPPVRSNPVGGAILPVNQLAVLAPYLALIGLVATLSTVYLIKRKRKT